MHKTLLLIPFLAAAITAQTVVPPFNAHYEAVDFGQMPGVPNYAGIAFAPGNPDVLLASAYQSGQVRAVPLVRDAGGRIVGFGASSAVATVGGNDGGLAFGPGNVLFFTWYGANRLGQILPGSTTASAVIDLQPLGIGTSVGSCAFVPAGRPGAGRFKLTTYSGSSWYDVSLSPTPGGTFAVTAVASPVVIQGGPEGILYPPANAPLLGNHVLVAEWNAGIAAYQTDGNGDPIPATRQLVLSGLSGNAGGALDPVTGDMLFSGNGGRLAALRTGAVCGTIVGYGPASPGTSVTPTLVGNGCARLGQAVTFQVDGAPFALGVFALGYYPIAVQFSGLTVLQSMNVTLGHALDGAGRYVLPLAIPNLPSLGDQHLYFQAGYLDAGTASGFSATAGVDLWVR